MMWIALMTTPQSAAEPGDFLEKEAETVWWVQDGPGTYGWVTEPLPDIDGDGIRDVVTGAPFAPGGGVAVLLSGADGSELHRVPSTVAGAQLSYSVSAAGDLDGDGVADALAGAPAAGSGQVVAISGADGSVLHDLQGDAPGDRFGESVADVDDVDGDGTPDFAVGASDDDDGGAQAGRVFVLSGADGAVIRTIDGGPGEKLGSGLASIADLDGDGLRDLVVGSPGAGASSRGGVSVFSSATAERILGPLKPGTGGVDLGRWFVGDPGDLNGDGVPDVYAGDFAGNQGSGLAMVFSGATGEVLWRVDGTGTEGLGVGREAGDVDGDGVGDLAVGSWQHAAGAAGAGRVSVLSGVDGQVLYTWTSQEAGENLGFDAVGIGDVDGDGGTDVLASGATGNNVYVLRGPLPWGSPEPPQPTEPTRPTDPEPEPTDASCGCQAPGAAITPAWWALIVWLRRARRRAAPRRQPGSGR